MKCRECKLMQRMENTEDQEKVVCTFPPFPRKSLATDIDDECHFHQKLSVELKDFHYVMDGDLPDDFEVCLIVERTGHLSAGCWDTGTLATKDGAPGEFRQSRGGTIDLEYVWAWLPIEEYEVEMVEDGR